ncbi:MAG: hypothetical protein HC834_07980 [Rhodospirillales bacterium]|nr:hypothetical protein [Rhodospirillales bacterium]
MSQPAIWWNFDHTLDRDEYVERVLDHFCRTHQCPLRPRPEDRRLAYRLYDRQFPLALLKAAFLLATMRRLYRPFDATPLERIHSLHYFVPVCEEIRRQAIDPAYFDYVLWKVRTAGRQLQDAREILGQPTQSHR